MLADVCEAVIAAVYRDGGLEAARRWLSAIWGPRIETARGPLRDAKTELQEWAHKRGFEAPTYVEKHRTGPDHRPEFEIEVSVGRRRADPGEGRLQARSGARGGGEPARREGVWET